MPTDFSKKIFSSILQKFPENARSVVLTCILSLSAGLSAVAFIFLTDFLFSHTFMMLAEKSKAVFILTSLIIITGTSLLSGYLVHGLSREAVGSGIPEIKTAYWKELGHMHIRAGIVKFFAGILSIGGGSSLGREGPSVYIGSSVSSNLNGLFGAAPRQRRSATLIGASAGLAAAFNTPVAAIMFVIEEILGDMNNRYLGRVVLAAVTGAFTVHAILGRHPAFSIPSIENISWSHYIIVPLVAITASYAGVFFQRMTLSLREKIRKEKRIPAWAFPGIGGLITWVIGCSAFLAFEKIGIFSLGYQDLSNALNNNFEWEIAGFLFFGKLLATTASYGFGGCGGIFAPSLFVGGMAGFFIGGAASIWLPLTPADQIVLTAVGMSSCLGAIVRAPLTSMLIVFEMTHEFLMVPGLMIGSIISQAIAHRSSSLNFYDMLLVQQGHELHKIRPPVDLQSWQNMQISAIASPNPVGLRDLSEKEMQEIIERYPYNVFPVFSGGSLQGIVTRQQIKAALLRKKIPRIEEIGTCYADQTVKEVGNKFVESAEQVLIVLERDKNTIRGIITLHDLIRAQASIQN